MTTKVMIDEREALDIIDLMRSTIPEEIKQSRRVNQDRERIIAQAQAEAKKMGVQLVYEAGKYDGDNATQTSQIDDLITRGAKAIVLLGPDLKEALPVLYLRVRRAVVDLDVPLVDVAARDHGAAVRKGTSGQRQCCRPDDDLLGLGLGAAQGEQDGVPKGRIARQKIDSERNGSIHGKETIR